MLAGPQSRWHFRFFPCPAAGPLAYRPQGLCLYASCKNSVTARGHGERESAAGKPAAAGEKPSPCPSLPEVLNYVELTLLAHQAFGTFFNSGNFQT